MLSHIAKLVNEGFFLDGGRIRGVPVAIELCVYCMKLQIFLDGNKRASVIFANHYLISHGNGLLVIPENKVLEFKKLLVEYYEGEDL